MVWAVHVADGVLDWPVLVAGFVVTGLLALVAARRVRDEEVPRIALLTAAFFVASSIHVKIGPTSVHLLLAGLVGVVLGWRAPLAILLGVALQAFLLAHGGLTTIGINAAVQSLPALAAAALFPVLLMATNPKLPWLRSLTVAGAALLWGIALTLAVIVLLTNPWRGLIQFSSEAGLILHIEHLDETRALLLHPITLGCL